MFIRVITSPPPAMRDLLFELAYSFLFANLTGILAFLVIGVVASRTQTRKFSLLPTLLICLLIFVPAGLLLGQTVLLAIGVVVPRNFWAGYLNSLDSQTGRSKPVRIEDPALRAAAR
jgi:hypothetical protein